MSDSLFLMQRYWGSDDSEVEEIKETSKQLDQNVKPAKEKKKKKVRRHDEEHEVIEINDDGDTSELITVSDSDYEPKHKKKKKKSTVQSNSIENVDMSKKNEQDSTAHSIELNGFDGNELFPNETGCFLIENPTTVQNGEFRSSAKSKKKRRKISVAESTSGAKDLEDVGEPVNDTTELSDATETKESETRTSRVELFPIIKDVLNKDEVVIQRSLPNWLANPTVIKINVNTKKKSIQDIDFLDDNTKNNLKKCGIQYLFPVQFKVIPWLLQTSSKRLFVRPSDLCVSAPTGSGKTLAFVIPIVQSLKKKVTTEVRALVVLPVKELAVQVYKVFDSFCKGTELNAVLIIGAQSLIQEQEALMRKCSRGFLCKADIVVATPGRILDHVNQTPGFTLNHLQYLVIDEADRMMEEIQRGWLKNIEKAIYKEQLNQDCHCFSLENQFQKCSLGATSACSLSRVAEPVQKLFYSATLSQDPEKLHELSLYKPKLFTSVVRQNDLGPENQIKRREEFVGKYTTPKGLVEKYVMCSASIKPLVICHIIREEQFQKVLCFTQSLEHAHRLHLVLSDMLTDMEVRELSSSLRMVQRKIFLQQFSSGKINVLVCSDLMARGMDIENVDCVFSYDAPHFIKAYIHRIGRTARAGKEGTAITLLERDEIPSFERMLDFGGKSLPSRLNIRDEELAPLEKTFKAALESASKTIASEHHEQSLLKRGVKKNFPSQKALPAQNAKVQ